ncbi:MAG: hypothetical protein JOY84_13355 [Curvibacter sp.]|nr:hypothetical protein [Curvibacter sp.]
MVTAAPFTLRFEPLANLRDAIDRGPTLRQLMPDAAKAARLVLLHAPAGFGKSTLLSQLAQAMRAEGMRVAWLNCDGRDQDSEVFTEDLCRALHRTGMRPASLEALAEIDAPLLICIDDFEWARNAQVGELIRQMALQASPMAHIVVAGRAPPPPRLTRLLLDGRAREVDAMTLRFTRQEAERLLQPASSADQLAPIVRQADGWPFALQLARLQARSTPSAKGTDDGGLPIPLRQIHDYLVQEVIQPLPTDLRDFLSDVAMLDKVDVLTANGLRVREDSLDLIRRLTRLRPLVVVDEHNGSAVLHPLLRDCLLDTRERGAPGEIAGLHRRVARHLALRGQLQEAVGHAIDGRRPELGAQLLEEAGGLLLLCNEGAVRSRRLLRQLPAATLQARPPLRLLRLMVRLLEGRTDGVQAEFAAVFEQVSQAQSCGGGLRRLDMAVAEVGLLLARSERDLSFSPWATLDKLRALARLQMMHDPRPMALNLAFEIFFLHRYGPAERCERRVREIETLFADGAYDRNSPWIWLYRARNALARGDLDGAEATLKERLAEDPNFQQFRQDSLARLSTALSGQIAYVRGDIDRAQAHFETLLPSLATDLLEVLYGSCVGLAACKFARGQTQSALQTLQAGRRFAQEESLRHLELLATATEIDLLLRTGDVGQAHHLAEQVALDTLSVQASATGALPCLTAEAVVRACWRVCLTKGDSAKAADAAEALLARARSDGQALVELSALYMLATARAALGQHRAAHQTLDEGLCLGQRQGALQPALDAGTELLSLLRHRLSDARAWPQGPARTFAVQVIGAWETRFRQCRSHHASQLLTPREWDVLRELAAEQSTKQMARSLALSPETIKHHLKNIFRKLAVSRREQALSEARHRGWIP